MPVRLLSTPDSPAWVRGWFEPGEPYEYSDRNGARVSVHESRGWRMLSMTVPGAGDMSAARFRRAVADAYRVIRACLGDGAAPHPVRVWNYLPGIDRVYGGGLDRYMVFSAGRYDAFTEWFGASGLTRRLPAASAVGCDGEDMSIHVLASPVPGRPIENARQVPAYRYSRRYGPLPPCFARAVVLDEAPGFDAARVALLSGTASVVGEATSHPDSLDTQLGETFTNLRVLLASAGWSPRDPRDALAPLREVRAYVPRACDAARVGAAVRRRLPGARRVELVHARLCRPDLLVEIEGVAQLADAGGAAHETRDGVTANGALPVALP